MEFVLICSGALLLGLVVGFVARQLYGHFVLTSAEQQAYRLKINASKNAEIESEKYLLEARSKIADQKSNFEREMRDKKASLARQLSSLDEEIKELDNQREDQKEQQEHLDALEKLLEGRSQKFDNREEEFQQKLESISELTKAQAKEELLKSVEAQAQIDALHVARRIEQQARDDAQDNARQIILSAIQDAAVETSSVAALSTVTLPNDEIKGRVIGKEGRNIRALETLTGADIVVDDTPGAVVVASFDPLRRVIAKMALERLVADGRIHPVRIEEVVSEVRTEVVEKGLKEADAVLYELKMTDVHPEMRKAVARLYYRYSFGQNILYHSREVARIAASIARELGADVKIAIRAAFLHDIGKGLPDTNSDGHVTLGADLATFCGEDPRVVNAIYSHHEEKPPSCVESVIAKIADGISAARPGARHEGADVYIHRMENLELIANSFEGVQKAFAVQSGRELRVILDAGLVSDKDIPVIARGIAKEIEKKEKFPGRIKVTLVKEMRIVEYAR